MPKDGVQGAEFVSKTTMKKPHFIITKWLVLGPVQQAILRPCIGTRKCAPAALICVRSRLRWVAQHESFSPPISGGFWVNQTATICPPLSWPLQEGFHPAEHEVTLVPLTPIAA